MAAYGKYMLYLDKSKIERIDSLVSAQEFKTSRSAYIDKLIDSHLKVKFGIPYIMKKGE